MAVDDTRLRKTGRRIQSAFYQYDPLSPKFRYNLMFGLRFLQVPLLVPLYRHAKASPRGLPVRFEEVPAVKHPRRNAGKEAWAAYRRIVRQQNLSQRAVALFRDLRHSLDQAGSAHKCLLVVGDNSFCNRTLFTASVGAHNGDCPRAARCEVMQTRAGRLAMLLRCPSFYTGPDPSG